MLQRLIFWLYSKIIKLRCRDFYVVYSDGSLTTCVTADLHKARAYAREYAANGRNARLIRYVPVEEVKI